MNAKSILCPNCKVRLNIGENCHHAEDLSLICGKCGKIVYPVDEKQETTINRSYSNHRGRNYVTAFGD